MNNEELDKLKNEMLTEVHGVKKGNTKEYSREEMYFLNFMMNTPKKDGSFYSETTAKNYVSAIKELMKLLTVLKEEKYKFLTTSFLKELIALRESNEMFPFEYKIGGKIANNFMQMNRLWNGTYSSAIKQFEKFILLENEISTERLTSKKQSKEDGNFSKVLINVYERNPVFRQECLENKGYSCHACGFNFVEKYGELGKEFIHVHHEIPLSVMKEKNLKLNADNLYPLCPNCHSMIHRTRPMLSVKEFKEKYIEVS